MKFPTEKFHLNFIDLFPSTNLELRGKMHESLALLESISESFCGAAWLNSQEFSYISPKIETILGYPYSSFFENGVLFFYSTIPSEYIESIRKQTEQHFKTMFSPSFKIQEVKIFETDGAARLHNGKEVAMQQQAVLLDFCEEDQSFFMVGIWHKKPKTPEKVFHLRKAHIAKMLTRIKSLYLQMYPQRFEAIIHPITQREKEIIGLLARGLSSKEISLQLGISFHTVETHRKKLLKKFKVNNTAQLIQEAGARFKI